MSSPAAELYLYEAAQQLSDRSLRVVAPALNLAPRPMAARAKARTRAMTPLHHHPVPEFCLALSGRAAMHMGERCWLLSPPALAVLTPGLQHAEGYARRGQPYTLLWFTAFSTSSVVAIISQYAASGRWQVLHKLPLRTRGIGAIVRRFDGRQPIDRGAVESLRADLLLLVSQLLRTRPAPASNTRSALWERHIPVLHRVRELLDEHYDQPLQLAQIAAMTRLSPNYLNTIFRRWSGQSVHAYLTARRMGHAMELCRSSDLLIKEIARAVGYDDPLYFSRAFARYHGCTPTQAQGGARR